MGNERNSARRTAAVAAGLVLLAALVACWLVWRARPPQMGADEEVFAGVDALFTAVTARDEMLLGRCEQQLRSLKDAGKMSGDAWDHLDGIIQKARAGRWESAAERLYDFMKAQRREGASEAAHHKPKKR